MSGAEESNESVAGPRRDSEVDAAAPSEAVPEEAVLVKDLDSGDVLPAHEATSSKVIADSERMRLQAEHMQEEFSTNARDTVISDHSNEVLVKDIDSGALHTVKDLEKSLSLIEQGAAQQSMQASGAQVFAGAGVVLWQAPSRVVFVHRVLKNGPAAGGRLQVGDCIVEVDGVYAWTKSIRELAPMIQKEQGTILTLLVYRPAQLTTASQGPATTPGELVRIQLKRGPVQTKDLEGEIGLLRRSVEGHILKKKTKLRFICLEANRLLVFEKKGDPEPKYTVFVDHCLLIGHERARRKTGAEFSFGLQSQDFAYYFTHDNKQALNQWFEAMSSIVTNWLTLTRFAAVINPAVDPRGVGLSSPVSSPSTSRVANETEQDGTSSSGADQAVPPSHEEEEQAQTSAAVDDGEVEGEDEPESVEDNSGSKLAYYVVYLRRSGASKNGLKPEIVNVEDGEPSRIVTPPEGAQVLEDGVYTYEGRRVRTQMDWPEAITVEERERVYRALKKYVRRFMTLPDTLEQLEPMFELADAQLAAGKGEGED